MFGKALFGLCGIAAPAAYFMGAFSGGAYDRVVAASPAEVRSALMDLDMREAPGEPGSDPSRAGGVAPMFLLSQEGEDMVWTVMSGDKVAVRLTARLEPVEGGTQTRVTSSYERGDAPDDFVSPAFRSKGTTLGLFAMVLEDELDELTRPANADPAVCQKIRDDFTAGNMGPQQPGFGTVAKAAIKLSALETKLKAAGCYTGFGPSGTAGPLLSDEGGGPVVAGDKRDGVQFEAGKPMIDVSGKR